MSPLIPEPFLLNTWKHWEAFQLSAVHSWVEQSHPFPELLACLRTIGASTMDVYAGSLNPIELGTEIKQILQERKQWETTPYQAWLAKGNGFGELIVSDGSIWICRLGDTPERYVHLHPGRQSPHCYRNKAHSLKTALLALYFHFKEGTALTDVTMLNELRVAYLDLSPMDRLRPNKGLGQLLVRWQQLLEGQSSFFY